MRILFFLLFPIFLSAQINRAYGVIEIGSTFPSSSSTGPKFAYRPVDSSFYRWVHTNVWVKVVEPSITPDTLYLQQISGTTAIVNGDTINLTPYVLKTDTSSMLAPYIKLAGWGLLKTPKTLTVDSTLLATKTFTNRFLLKSDSAAMLANYPSTVGYGILKNTKTIRADTTSPNGLATRLFAKTLPTSIVAGRIAVSDGSNLVGYSGLTWNNATTTGTITGTLFGNGSSNYSDAPTLPASGTVHSTGSTSLIWNKSGGSNFEYAASIIGSFSNNQDGLYIRSGGDKSSDRRMLHIENTDGTNVFSVRGDGTAATLLKFQVGSSSPALLTTSTLTLSNASSLSHSAGSGIHFSPFGASNAVVIKQNTGNLLLGTTTDVATSILTARSTTKSSSPFPLHTLAESDAITGVRGNFDYETTQDGLRWYNGTRKAYALESTFARGTATRVPYFDANGQVTDDGDLLWNSSLNYLSILRSSPAFNLDINGSARVGNLELNSSGSAGTTGQGIITGARQINFISQGTQNAANTSAFSFSPFGGAYTLTQNATGRTMAFMDLNGSIGNPNIGLNTFGMLRIRPSYNFPTVSASEPRVGISGILYDPILTAMYVPYHNFLTATSGNIVFATSGSGALGMGTSTPNGSSVVDFNSTSKGSLLTRMNTMQRNAIVQSVLSATVTSGGSGYSSQPTMTITGGGGTGAIVFANLTAGVITSISILNQGENYTSNPTLTITGGGGTGGAGTLNLAPIPESLLFYNIDSIGFEYRGNASNYLQIATKQYARSLFSATTWLKPQLEAGNVTISKASTPSSLNLKNIGINLKDTAAKTTHYIFNSSGIPAYVAYKTGDAGNLGGTYVLADTLGKDFAFYTLQDDASVQQNSGTGPQVVNYITHPSLPSSGAAWSYGIRIDTSVSIPTVRHMYGNRYATTTNPGTHKFLAGLRGDEILSGFDFRSSGTDGKLSFNVNSALNIRQGGKVYFALDSTFSFDPSTDLLQLSAYGTPATTASALSKTQSNYIAGFATDGTVVEMEDLHVATTGLVTMDEYNNSASFTPTAVGEEATELFLTTSATTGKVLQRGMRQTTNVKDADLAITDDMLELSFDIHVWAYCSNAASDSVVIDLPTPALDYVSQKVSVYGDGRNATPGRDVYVRCVGAKLWHGNASPTGETYYQVTSLGGINSKTAEFICVQNPDDSLYYWQLIQHQ